MIHLVRPRNPNRPVRTRIATHSQWVEVEFIGDLEYVGTEDSGAARALEVRHGFRTVGERPVAASAPEASVPEHAERGEPGTTSAAGAPVHHADGPVARGRPAHVAEPRAEPVPAPAPEPELELEPEPDALDYAAILDGNVREVDERVDALESAGELTALRRAGLVTAERRGKNRKTVLRRLGVDC